MSETLTKRRGRPPLGDRPMTYDERRKKYLARHRDEVATLRKALAQIAASGSLAEARKIAVAVLVGEA